jgi:hypothetical protein
MEDTMKTFNICPIRVPEEKERKNEREAISEERVAVFQN